MMEGIEKTQVHPRGLNFWLNFWLIIITVLMTLGYTAFWLWQAFGSKSANPHVDSIIGATPRPMIVLCWAAAAITIAFLPEIGKILAGLSLGGVVVFFGYWWNITSGIKSNLGVDKIPGADALGNFFIGAHPIDVFFGVVAILLIAFDGWVIWKNLSLHFHEQSAPPLTTVIAHK